MTDKQTVKISAKNLPVSFKQTQEISNFIKHKSIKKAKEILNRVIEMKTAIPYKRFNKDTGHKKGRIAAGRYPIKASKQILKLLGSIEANAQHKGLDTNSLFIKNIIPNKAARAFHYGRKRGLEAKRTHLEIIAEERLAEVTKK